MVTIEWGEFVYAPPSCRDGDVIILPSEEAHHLYRVRRMEKGREVCSTDGEGMVYRCITASDHYLEIVEPLPMLGEPSSPILLCAGVLKGDSNKEAVDAATQLGASTIVFFQAQRSEGKLREDKLEKLKRVAITAIKQCGRACLPKILLASDIEHALALLPEDCMKFIAHPFEDLREIGDMSAGNAGSSASVLVGPEGGFTDEEVDYARRVGCRPLILARRRLRAETAISAGLTFLLTRTGEFKVTE